MRHRLTAAGLVFGLTLAGCGSDSSCDPTAEASCQGDAACVVQAGSAASVASLLEAVARQPEMVNDLITKASTEVVWPSTGAGLCCQAQVARVDAMSQLFDSAEASPDVISQLTTAAGLLGSTSDYLPSCCDAEAARMTAAGELVTVVAMAPDDSAVLEALATQFIGPAPASGGLCCSAQAARMDAAGLIITAQARQPEAADALDALAVTFIGTAPSLDTLCAEALAERQKALGALYEAIARQPEATTILVTTADTFLGVP